MNFKSGILKLSIIFMLVLVLIPVACAMDSNETFFEEYDYPDEEEVIVEYDSPEEVEDTQDGESSIPDQQSAEEDDKEESYNEEDSYDDYTPSIEYDVEQNEDIYTIPEFKEDSAVEPHDIIVEVEDNKLDLTSDLELTNNINESREDDLTLEKLSVNVQGSFYISKKDIAVYHMLNKLTFYNGLTASIDNDMFKRDLVRNLLLNDYLLFDASTYTCSGGIVNFGVLDERMLDSIVKIVGDFAYSIDNSVIGDECIMHLFNMFSFSDFCPCFDAVFCCDFLVVEYGFCGDCMVAAAIFCDGVVDYSFNNGLLSGVNLIACKYNYLNLITITNSIVSNC